MDKQLENKVRALLDEHRVMIQRGHGARFLLEAPAAVGVCRELGRQRFDGDIAVEPRVAGPINLAHPSSTDGRQDLIRTKTHTRR